MGEVVSYADGWYKWRGFRQKAWSLEDGYSLLNAAWHEQQRRHAIAVQMQKERKQELRARDEHKQEIRGMKLVLTHSRLKEVFSGWFRKEGTKAIFVEDATWIEVQVDLAG